MQNDNELFPPEEMLNPFDAIKEVDAEGREWWNSRHLARLRGYVKYWNFERLMGKSYHLIQICERHEVQLSVAIKKILNPLDNCEVTGSMIMMQDKFLTKRLRPRLMQNTKSSGGYMTRPSA